MTALLEVAGLSKRFRGLLAVDNVSFSVAERAMFAIIGPNGAGKTTLFNIIAGVLPPDNGSIHFAGKRIDRLGPDESAGAASAAPFSWCVRFLRSRSRTMSSSAPCCTGPIPAARRRAHEVLWHLDLFDKRARSRRGSRCRTASGWKSRARSPPIPSCCCSTRLWRACGRRRPTAWWRSCTSSTARPASPSC